MIKKLTPIIASCALLCACTEEKHFDGSGTFETVEVIVSSEIAGKLLKFEVEEGDIIEKGKQIGQIDDLQYVLQKQNLEAQISALKNKMPDVGLQLEAMEERLAKQEFERKRTEGLVAAKAVLKKQLDDIESDIRYLKKDIAATKDTLDKSVLEITDSIKALRAQIAQIDDNINKSRLLNPIDGTVLVKYAEPGEVVSFGKPLYKIANLNEMRLRAYFSAAEVTKLKLGQTLKIRADFGRAGTREYEGKLIWVSGKSEFTPKGIRTADERADLVYAAKISVANDGYLKIGQYAEAEIPESE